jgi:hypothetical protein
VSRIELEDVPSDAASSLAPPDDMMELLQERRLQARRIGSVAVELRISKPTDRLADPADR